LTDDQVDAEIFHGGVEDLFHGGLQAVNFIEEEYFLTFQGCEDGG